MSFATAADRIRSDFNEMPGLELTIGQGVRLWNLGADDCRNVLDALVDAGFLQWTTRRTIVRAGNDRRREYEGRAIGLEQIDRTHVGAEPALNQVDDVGEGLGRIAAARDKLADLLERPEQALINGYRGIVGHCRGHARARTLPELRAD